MTDSPITKETLEVMSEKEAIEATTGMNEHPEAYEGPCACDSCFSYGD